MEEREIYLMCVCLYVHAFSLAPFGVLVTEVDPSPDRILRDCRDRRSTVTMVIVSYSLYLYILHKKVKVNSH